jgi:hypothetical protein
MSRFNYVFNLFVTSIKYLFGLTIQEGEVEFVSGEHQILIKKLDFPDTMIWLNISPESDIPTCGYLGNDVFSIREIEDAFILYANVESNKRKVYWMIK